MDTLIDRYLAAVSEILPTRLRTDTVTEISSLIQDALDDRSKAEGRPPDEQMMADVLKQFGSPEKIVAPYLPEKYLIGPRLYPSFIMVLRIVLPVIAVLSLVGLWIGPSLRNIITGPELLTNLLKALGNALSSVVQAFGNIVLIFAIFQLVLPEFKLAGQEKEWDPHSLKAISLPDKIKRGDLIIEIFFSLVGLIIFTFYLDRIGIYNFSGSQWTVTPILTSVFNTYIPWLDLFWVLVIILNAFLLRKGSWSIAARIFSIAINGLSIGIAVSMMTHIQFLYTLKGALGQFGETGIIQSLVNQILIVALFITIIVNAVKIVRMVWHIIKGSLSL